MNLFDPRLPNRFWNKVVPEPNTGCWLWIGALNNKGYGNVGGKGWNALAHRMTFIAAHGSVPDGLELDHLCRTSCCCNPAHLEPVTHIENVRRGGAQALATAAAAKLAKARTTCKRGHEFTEQNTRIEKNGARACRACGALLARLRRQRRVA